VNRAAWIAVQARRISALVQVLPDEEYAAKCGQARSRAYRANYAVSRSRRLRGPAMHPLDVLLVGGASEMDLICARAVRKLSRRERPLILDELTDDHLLAIYYATPDRSQAVATRQPEIARALQGAPEGVGEFIAVLNLMTGTGTSRRRTCPICRSTGPGHPAV
jgi:hypothetical protein